MSRCEACGDETGGRPGRYRVVLAFTHGMERFLSEHTYTDDEAHALWEKCRAAGLNCYVERVS